VYSLGWRWRRTATGAKMGAEPAILTSTTTAGAAATGAAVCRTTHRGQWSPSLWRGWLWATWATVNKASRTRHNRADSGKAGRFAPSPRRKSAQNPISYILLFPSLYRVGSSCVGRSTGNPAWRSLCCMVEGRAWSDCNERENQYRNRHFNLQRIPLLSGLT